MFCSSGEFVYFFVYEVLVVLTVREANWSYLALGLTGFCKRKNVYVSSVTGVFKRLSLDFKLAEMDQPCLRCFWDLEKKRIFTKIWFWPPKRPCFS